MTSLCIKNIESCNAGVTLCDSKILLTLAQRQYIACKYDMEKSWQVCITANSKKKGTRKVHLYIALALCHVGSYKRKTYSRTNFNLQVPLL